MGGIRIGRLAGIDIIVHPSWFLIFALLTWSLSEGLFLEENPGWERTGAWAAGLATSLLFFTSLLLHEFSHCVVALRRGLEVKSVTLFIFGGVSSLKGEPREPADEFRIAIVGPITSFSLAGVFALAGLALWGTGADTAAFYLAAINVLLGVFNLLPGFPLDGGRVLRSFLWARSRSLHRATRVASQVGSGMAFVLMAGGVAIALAGAFLSGIWLIVIGWFLRSQAEASYEQMVTRDVLESTPVRAVMQSDYRPVHPNTTLSSLVHDYVLLYHDRYYPVSSDGRFLGLVTLSDVGKFERENWDSHTVADAMTPVNRLHCLDAGEKLSRAAEIMAAERVNQLPVMDRGELLGFLTRADVVRVIQVHGEIAEEDSPLTPQRDRQSSSH